MGLQRLRKQENSVGASRDGIPFVRGAAGARFDSKLLPQLERNFRYTVNTRWREFHGPSNSQPSSFSPLSFSFCPLFVFIRSTCAR